MRKTEEGILIRLYEGIGRETAIKVDGLLLKNGNLHEVGMSGKNTCQCDAASVFFHPFEIKTFIIK